MCGAGHPRRRRGRRPLPSKTRSILSSSGPRRRWPQASPTGCARRAFWCFGPSQAAAELEASKRFTKEICDACGAPTAAWARFTEAAAAQGLYPGAGRADRGQGRRAGRRQGRDRGDDGGRGAGGGRRDVRRRVRRRGRRGGDRGIHGRAKRRRSSCSATARPCCRSAPRRTTSAWAKATPGRTPAAWGPIRPPRCWTDGGGGAGAGRDHPALTWPRWRGAARPIRGCCMPG